MTKPNPAKPFLIERQEQLDDLHNECIAAGVFGFDTEFVMEDRFESEVCLIQIATPSSVAIIDPFLDLDITPVWKLVSSDQVTTIVHAGQEDLSLCVQHTGQMPGRVYDLQLAAGLAGFDYPISLQRLVQLTKHIKLHKSKTLTDWRKRPLTPDQIGYAAQDVAHLLAVQEILRARLDQLGRSSWADEEFARFKNPRLFKRTKEDKIARLKGAGSLNGQQLAILQRVIAWREETAQRVNRPARTVLKDYLVVEVAKHSLSSVADIRGLRGVNLGNRDVEQLCKVVVEARSIPKQEWPTPKKSDAELPQETALVALVTAVLRGYCLDHQLAYSLVATQKTIRQLVRHRMKPEDNGQAIDLLSGWRGHSVGTTVDDVLTGQRSVRVESSKNKWTVLVTPQPDHAPPSE